MEELFIAVIGGIVELLWEVMSFACCWGGDFDLLSPGVAIPLLWVCAGGGAGWISTLVFKHAILSQPWMRIAALVTLPPVTGWQVHRLAPPADAREGMLQSARFWLPLLAMLSFCAVRLLGISR